MSKRIFINNLDTYVSQAIFSELRNDQPDEEGNKPDDANIILGTYINKDSSIKPEGVKKMLKRSKPRLAGQYIQGCDLIVYDLHSGNPMDVKMAIDALAAPKGGDDEGADGEKVLILISSLLAWDATPKKLVEVRDPREIAAEEAALQRENETRIQQEINKIRAERQKKRDILAAQENGSDDQEAPEEENTDEQDMQTALKIVAAEKADLVDDKKARLKKKMLHIAFTEQDFEMRRASDEYACIREAEEYVLSFKRENIKTYVIAAGLLYGKGEAILNSHFKKAWLQDPIHLPVVGQGNNLVPTVHVTDLARMVKKIYESKPERQYIFGIDTNEKPTQKRLITAISSGIGTGLIEKTDIPPSFAKVHPNKTPLQLDLDWRKFLLLNIKAKPSSLFVGDDLADGEEAGEPGEGDFNWHCRAGLAGNIQLVKDEFCKQRGLKPFKIALSGKPCTGKSHFSQQLAQHYNVPHVHIAQVLNDIEHWQDEKEANQKERKILQSRIADEAAKRQAAENRRKEEADKKVAKARADRKAQKKLEQGEDYVSSGDEAVKADDPLNEEPSGDPAEPGTMANKFADYQKKLAAFDKENAQSDDDVDELPLKTKINQQRKDHTLKIDQDMLSEAFRWRLCQNDCQNRGYVLDGYPISYQTSEQVFYIPGKAPEKKPDVLNEETGEMEPAVEEEIDEEALAEMLKPKFQSHIYPDSVILIRGEDKYIRDHAKSLSKQDNTKWDVDNLHRRLAKWHENNSLALFKSANTAEDLGMPNAKQYMLPMTRFFQENKTEVFEIDCSRHQFEMFEAMRVYVERNGRSYNYLSSVKSLNHKREEHLTQEERDAVSAETAANKQSANVEQAKREALVALAEGRLDFLENHMDGLKMCDKMFMRQFLMKCIIPVLTEGMIDVWRVGPTDPVDYLADYVFRKSNEMK